MEDWLYYSLSVTSCLAVSMHPPLFPPTGHRKDAAAPAWSTTAVANWSAHLSSPDELRHRADHPRRPVPLRPGHYWKTDYGNQLEMTLSTGFSTGFRKPRPMRSAYGIGFFIRCLSHSLVSVGKTNQYHRGCHADASWQPFGTGWSFQPIPMSFLYFNQIQFWLFCLLLFILL